MATMQAPNIVTVPAGDVNVWKRLFDQTLGAKICRLLVQNQGVGNLRLSPQDLGNVLTNGILLQAPTPAAGGLPVPVSFVDEATGCPGDNHTGEWWYLADTTGLVFVWAVWL